VLVDREVRLAVRERGEVVGEPVGNAPVMSAMDSWSFARRA